MTKFRSCPLLLSTNFLRRWLCDDTFCCSCLPSGQLQKVCQATQAQTTLASTLDPIPLDSRVLLTSMSPDVFLQIAGCLERLGAVDGDVGALVGFLSGVNADVAL